MSYNQRYTIFKLVTSLLCVLIISAPTIAKIHNIPDELYNGMIKFELDSGKYFDSLVLMDEEYQAKHYVSYLAALQGFNITQAMPKQLAKALKLKDISDSDYYQIGKIEYLQGNCIPALKAFKKIKNNKTLEYREPWSFYRANCFIKLGSNARAVQALNDALSGTWAAYAYYNLAVSYAETSRDKVRA